MKHTVKELIGIIPEKLWGCKSNLKLYFPPPHINQGGKIIYRKDLLFYDGLKIGDSCMITDPRVLNLSFSDLQEKLVKSRHTIIGFFEVEGQIANGTKVTQVFCATGYECIKNSTGMKPYNVCLHSSVKHTKGGRKIKENVLLFPVEIFEKVYKTSEQPE